MNRSKIHSKRFTIIILACLLAIAISACSASQPESSNTPAQPVEMTRVVVRRVTQEVTQVVTRIVEVPVTVTPAPTQAPTSTPDPSVTRTAELPQATLPEYTDCLYGPGSFYTYKTSFPAGQVVEVVGRSQDGAWINIEAVHGWNSCWIQAAQAQLQSSRLEDLPVVTTMLPRSEYEFGSPSPAARRDGDEVTVSWEAVYMSRDEIQGYLIDAQVCQGGQYIHLPVFVPMTFDQNVGTISVKITDEAGCTEPSTGHIVSLGKRGFAEWEKIFWPPR